jgi:hypothetical protein
MSELPHTIPGDPPQTGALVQLNIRAFESHGLIPNGVGYGAFTRVAATGLYLNSVVHQSVHAGISVDS